MFNKELLDAYRMDEMALLEKLIWAGQIDNSVSKSIESTATDWIKNIREMRKKTPGIDSFLSEYALSTDEGIALMCLAEALLRIPDKANIDRLIRDKLSSANWEAHLGKNESFFINATTWALMLSGNILSYNQTSKLSKTLKNFLSRKSETIIRKAVQKAMRIMSHQFIMGSNPKEALLRAENEELEGYRHSFDMLGEAALTNIDAERYFNAYLKAIETIGLHTASKDTKDIYKNPGVSIKLSALHPRYQELQREKVLKELPAKIIFLAHRARELNLSITIDAEEADRLLLSLDIIKEVLADTKLAYWNGFGLAVQSYQKRAYYVLDWVSDLAKKQDRRIMVRLVKGAYWDSEIKKTQVLGLHDYPVFTRKVYTDVSFGACAKKLFTLTDFIYPQFATHNAYSVALILELANSANNYRDFEFQCLHGMGVELYSYLYQQQNLDIPCRIYAPVGSHEDLLPYLVRRLLENGANSSFVNRIADAKAPISTLVENPIIKAEELMFIPNPKIPNPHDIFMPERNNSKGLDLSDRKVISNLYKQFEQLELCNWHAEPIIAKGSKIKNLKNQKVYSPSDFNKSIGSVSNTQIKQIDYALEKANRAFLSWGCSSVKERVNKIHAFAELLEKNTPTLLALLNYEAGKTMPDAIGEIREAIDFCNYYASEAEKLLSEPKNLKGYTGELNELSLHPRGIILCISPWNFPLAIFTGQIIAALVTGNTVIAKPAEQTPLIAYFVVKLMLKAKIPDGVVQLLPGEGEIIGRALVADLRIKGIVFTGSTVTATYINQTLATRGGAMIPIIAETGGQNAMIVDSTALLEQVVIDVLSSAFGAAGQRCSALRVLYIQEEIYERLIKLLIGAMQEIQIGDPHMLKTDVGPVIDLEALKTLKKHVEKMRKEKKVLFQVNLGELEKTGFFMPPTLIAINNIKTLTKEVFGPILHVISFKENKLDDVIHQINSTGYGLTFGIHSRINRTVEYVRARIHSGNIYVNRNMIGAVVGLQPFGGEGLSGTGPKAGGPHYLPRFCLERTFTVDTTAAGGNATLMSLPEIRD